jgi:hypothetical protein
LSALLGALALELADTGRRRDSGADYRTSRKASR